MKTKLEQHKLPQSVAESLEEQELLELAKALDLRRKQEKKSLWRRIFDPNILTIEMWSATIFQALGGGNRIIWPLMLPRSVSV